jgi:lipopolysaccharide transport system ATP-binding protein
MSLALRLTNVAKRYPLGEVSTKTLAFDLQRAWSKWRGQPDPFLKIDSVDNRTITRREGELGTPTHLWALRDINLEVKEGEILGVIGRNGAGKSTLLKLLSRITSPTYGRIQINGRLASLLEVGTGFHPELTGRENTYLNGAILGMRRHEIKKQLSAIVDFSGCGKHFDTPVKRYSSGMTVRLGFAVAAHLNCEILIVDEVLAVGDVRFQNQCLGKMREISSESGRTVLFVSHNVGSIQHLCTRAIVLEDGRCCFDGNPEAAVSRYLDSCTSGHGVIRREEAREAGKDLTILSASIVNADGCAVPSLINSERACLKVEFEVHTPGQSYAIAAELQNSLTGPLFSTSTLDMRPVHELGDFDLPGLYVAVCELPLAMLREGTYSIKVAATVPAVRMLDTLDGELVFKVQDTISPIAILGEGRRGVIAPRLHWSIAAQTVA